MKQTDESFIDFSCVEFLPGCLKWECESKEDFPTATVVKEFVEYAGINQDKKIILEINQKYTLSIASSSMITQSKRFYERLKIMKNHKKSKRQKWLKNHTSLDRLKG